MQFGITLKPDISVERIVGLTRQAEAAGFEYGWIFDSHVLWMEPYPLMTLMATNTKRMRLGTCVTNPATRDLTVTASLFATLNLISGGRMELGIGRGDSSRRVMGKKPVSWSQLEAAVKEFRDLTSAQGSSARRAADAHQLGRRILRECGLRATARRCCTWPGAWPTESSCSSPIRR